MSIDKKNRYLHTDNHRSFHGMLNVGLFCTSYPSSSSACVTAAQQLGRWVGSHLCRLVYGGVDCGLMYEVANSTQEAGGEITGVVTSGWEAGGRASSLPDTIIRAESLSRRKQILMELSDIFVVLPGGFGTLDEALSVLAAAHLQEHQKQLILFNLDGFFNPLLCLFEHLIQTGYAAEKYRDYYTAVSKWDECEKILANHLSQKLHNER